MVKHYRLFRIALFFIPINVIVEQSQNSCLFHLVQNAQQRLLKRNLTFVLVAFVYSKTELVPSILVSYLWLIKQKTKKKIKTRFLAYRIEFFFLKPETRNHNFYFFGSSTFAFTYKFSFYFFVLFEVQSVFVDFQSEVCKFNRSFPLPFN
jgi:hypothetical protein